MSISLTKGQTVSLTKKSGGALSKVRMGLGWDAAKKKGFLGRMSEQSIDLDASALLFDASGNVVDTIWYNQLVSKDGSIVHTGDNRTGAGDGDDESIKVDLSALPSNVQTVVFTVNSFTGQGFAQVENAFCRLVDEANEDEIARYDLSATGSHTAQIMAKVSRDGAGWSMTAIGGTASGRTVAAIAPAAAQHL
ncbi:TerD family protein [Nocardioides sp. 616]|uniref:TerD family protein n=1 Tax=Nocardioides sp. 616 TaxID=2268090 RepID=UPI000CE4B6DF|nr:TerD family protein [Nocardioides sp. 616]